MAKQTAKNAILLINGYDFSAYGTMYDIKQDVGKVKATGFEAVENFVPGLFHISGAIDLIWDSAANKVHVALSSMPTGVISIIPEGYALGTPSISFPMMQGNYSPKGNPAGILLAGSIAFENYGSTGVGGEPGVALQHGTITATTTGTGFDDATGAAVTAASGGTLHVWTPTLTDTYVVKIQHSTLLGSGYADLITFSANGTTRTAERQVVTSGTVNRYRRIVATRTGSAADPFGFSVLFYHL